MKYPAALWFLIFWLLILSMGGLYGGIAMLLDPSGGLLQMAEVLPLLPVPNYVLPGLFLLGLMGVFPLFLIYGLWVRPEGLAGKSLYSPIPYHWSWTGTVSLSIVLALWLSIQGFLIGFQWPIQYFTAMNGLIILLSAFFPSLRRFYRIDKRKD
jgi:hypothetical protein